MCSRHLLCAICCLALLSVCLPAQAQPVTAWVSGGLGGSLASRGIGLSGRASVHVVVGKLAISGRLTANSGGSSGIEGLFGTLRDEFFDSALLIGYASSPDNWKGQFIVGGGPAVVKGRRIIGRELPPCGLFGCGAEWEDLTPSIGLAMEAGAYGRFFSVVGYTLCCMPISTPNSPSPG